MKRVNYNKWLKYYINLKKNFNFFYIPTINFLNNLQSSVYLEHSFSFNNGKWSKFRGLICLNDLKNKDYFLIFNYLKSFIKSGYKNVFLELYKLKLGIIKYDSLILGFDFNYNSRIKFYYITNKNNEKFNYFNNLEFSRIIKGYDIFIDKEKVYNKKYIILNKKELIKNKRKLIKIFGLKFSYLIKYIDGLNIAIKKNGNFISLDFKLLDKKEYFFYILKKYYNLKININSLDVKKVTYLSIKYNIDIKQLDINNFNIYFYD